ncbi:MAG: peptide ABC transporter substrate-binding protein [Peptococcaceae bacterium]|jgi:ABC-type oligopeptide transport system substrate-binding subunit|nr:peptide ABC transporter substrate-binding protein [Peptococcaceae bacterium]
MKSRQSSLTIGLVLILSLGLLLAACGGSQANNGSPEVSQPSPGGTPSSSAPQAPATVPDASGESSNDLAAAQEITIALSQELNSIDPIVAVDSNSSSAQNNIYEGLYRLDAQARPIPAGAKALPEISADGLTYTIQLNENARWSNGAALTADDYIYAWSRAIAADNAAENQQFFTYVKNADKIISGELDISELGVRKIDDYTLEIAMEKPATYFTSVLVSTPFFPLSPGYVESQGAAFGSDSDHAIYNGPFILTEFSGPGIGADWVYVKNDTYWDKDNVILEKINIKVVKETGTAVNLFSVGEVDQIGIAGEYAQNEINNPAFVSANASTLAFLGYNHTSELFKNKDAREAISLLIDRGAVATNLLGDGSAAATGITPYNLQAHPVTGEDFARTLGDYVYTDVERAKELWERARGDLGITTVALDIISFDSDRMKTVGAYLQGLLEENLTGVSVNLNITPVSVFMENAKKQDFSLYLVTWGPDFSDATSLLELFESASGNNWGLYSNPDYDAALRAANNELAIDAVGRWDKLQEAERIILTDFGVSPIFFQSTALLRNVKLKDIIYHTTYPIYDYKSAYLVN